MENSEMEGNKKQKMDLAKPLMRPISSFQVMQKTTFGDVGGTSISPPLAPNENNKVENSLTRNAIPGSVFVDSTSKLAEQVQAPKPDVDPNLDPKKLRRIMSNRLSAQRSRQKKLGFLTNLEIQAKTYEDQIAKLQPQLASYQNQKEFLMMEQQTLHQKMEMVQEEISLRDVDIEKNRGEVNRLREVLVMQQEQQLQAQMLNLNFGMLEPLCNDPISNYSNSYQVAGIGMESSCIPEDLSQMWIPDMPNMHNELNLSDLPNYMGPMDLTGATPPNPNP